MVLNTNGSEIMTQQHMVRLSVVHNYVEYVNVIFTRVEEARVYNLKRTQFS